MDHTFYWNEKQCCTVDDCKKCKEKTLQGVVECYKNKFVPRMKKHVEFLKNKSFDEAFDFAVRARDSNEKMHPHQCRVGNEKLEEWHSILNTEENKKKIKGMETFKDLHDFISEKRIRRVGDLTVYDMAFRIGANLGILPEEVYLHCGAREGAEKFLRPLPGDGKVLAIEYLQGELGGLTAYELENMFCVCKEAKINPDT